MPTGFGGILEGVLKDFDVARCDVVSLGKLDKVIDRGTDKYSYVFIDEAHRFRNSDTDSFTMLHQICRGKKVVLISATPINNYTSDIENQIYLFQAKNNGTINGIKNIEGFFRSLNSNLAKLKKGTSEYSIQQRKNSEIIRDKVLREVMVRRTRSEIEEYYADDLKKQGLSFPKVGSPEKIVYEFDNDTDNAFQETMRVIKDFQYSRYMPLTYLKDKKKYATLLTGQKNMGGFMKGILIKRLESSFYAFRMTLQRFIDSYDNFIKMARSGDVYISKKVDVYDLLDNGDTEKLIYMIEQSDIMKFETKEFESRFMKDLESDLSQLKYLQDIWDMIDDDPKLDEFRENLTQNKVMKGHKIVVFTESKETAEYLNDQLTDIYGDRVIYFSGQSKDRLKTEIEDSFNPKFEGKNNDKYDLLITTDVLAEGVNLHRSNVLVNYDLPWNPTRIMQRVGRINRVGTSFDRIYVFNFFPTSQSNKQVPMEDRILDKLQQFHDTLGEDYKYLSEEEVVSPKKLFSDLTQDMDETEESTNPELKYLAAIRKIRDDNIHLFSQVRKLPKKSKAGRISNEDTKSGVITFIRQGALKTFFYSNEETSEQLTFMEAIKYIECEPDERTISVGSDYYDYLEKNDNAFDDMISGEETISADKAVITGNDAKVIKYLKAMKKDERLTDDQEEQLDVLIERWRNGEIPSKVSKEIVKKSKTIMDVLEFYYEIIKIVPPVYFEERKEPSRKYSNDKQVILSCYMKAGGRE